jgi:hypothetical protein
MGEFGKDCSDCGRNCRKPKDSAALFVCYALWECTKWETGEGISFLRGFCPFPPRRFSRTPLPTTPRDATVALCQSERLLSSARSVPSRPSQHSKTRPRKMCFLAAMKRVQLPQLLLKKKERKKYSFQLFRLTRPFFFLGSVFL